MTASRRLWIPLIAPAVAFGVEGAIGWWAGARICGAMPVSSVRILMGIVTAAMLAVTGAALLSGLARDRDPRTHDAARSDVDRFLATGIVFVSASFLVGIAWFGLNTVVLHACGWTR